MDRKQAIEKTRKCLALAKSANANEAAIALRQAQSLMEKYSVDENALLAAEITEVRTTKGALRNPPRWISWLVVFVARAFGCKSLLISYQQGPGKWAYIGPELQAQIAMYAHDVLLRQIKRARDEFIKDHCKRLLPKNKTRRADLFCEAFVSAASHHIREFAGATSTAALDAFMAIHHPDVTKLNARNRNEGLKPTNGDQAAAHLGHQAGKDVRISRGVGTDPNGRPTTGLGVTLQLGHVR